MELNPVWVVFGISFVCVLLIWSVLRYAESTTVQQPWIDVAPKVVPPVDKPTGNYLLYSGNKSTNQYWVLADSEKWKSTRAADSCAKAAKEHELLIKKFMDLPETQRARRVPHAMNLADTESTVMWAQKSGDLKFETVGETTFAFVDPQEKDYKNLMLNVVSSILGDPEVIRPQLETLYSV